MRSFPESGMIRCRWPSEPWRSSRASVADRFVNRRTEIDLLVLDVEPCDEYEGFRTTVIAIPLGGKPLPSVGDTLTVEARYDCRTARIATGTALHRFLIGFPEWPTVFG